MKITMSDWRSETRNAKEFYENGERFDKTPSADGGYYVQDYGYTSVVDKREVEVKIEPEIDGDVPGLLKDTEHRDRHIVDFFVDRIGFSWERNLDKGWKRSRIYVSGDNRRADGSRGQKSGSTKFPTYHKEIDGVITEADYAWYTTNGREMRDYMIENLGKPREVDRPDPLPAWLEKIVSAHHPVTGDVPFTHGNVHVYGEFA